VWLIVHVVEVLYDGFLDFFDVVGGFVVFWIDFEDCVVVDLGFEVLRLVVIVSQLGILFFGKVFVHCFLV